METDSRLIDCPSHWREIWRAALGGDVETVNLLVADDLALQSVLDVARKPPFDSAGLIVEGVLQHYGYIAQHQEDEAEGGIDGGTGSAAWLYLLLIMSGFDVRMAAKDLDWLAMAWEVRFNRPFQTRSRGDFHRLLHDLVSDHRCRTSAWDHVTMTDLAIVLLRKNEGGSCGEDAMWTECNLYEPPSELNIACRRLVGSRSWLIPDELRDAFEAILGPSIVGQFDEAKEPFSVLRSELERSKRLKAE